MGNPPRCLSGSGSPAGGAAGARSSQHSRLPATPPGRSPCLHTALGNREQGEPASRAALRQDDTSTRTRQKQVITAQWNYNYNFLLEKEKAVKSVSHVSSAER